MSVRAYKIIEVIREDEPAFNCWHDDYIMDIANLDRYNDGGTIELERSALEELLKEAEKELKNGKKPSDHFKNYETDIHDVILTIKNCLASFDEGEDYQSFDCF